MKILVVSQYFWPENFRINDLVRGLAERGHQVTVLTGFPNYPEGRFAPGYSWFRKSVQEYCGARIFRVPLFPRGRGGSIRLVLNYFSFVFTGCLLGPLLCRGKYDLVFVHEPSPVTVGLPALLLKKIKKAPLMFWVQDLWPESLLATGAVRSSLILGGVSHLVRFIYRRCDRILVASRSFRPSVLRHAGADEKISYFPQSADEFYRPLKPEPGSTEEAEMPRGFRLLFAGNIGVAQDFVTILNAAELLKGQTDIHWVIIGEGRMRPWVEDQIARRRLEETVHLLGWRNVEAMPRYFSLADGLLVSLKKDPLFSLTVPGKLQSYLACAKPVIAALDGEGAAIVRESGAGFVAPAEDPEQLAAAVRMLYGMTEEQRSAIGLCGREYFERNFERNALMARLEEWFGEICR